MSRAHRAAAALVRPPSRSARIRRVLLRAVAGVVGLYVVAGFVSLRLTWAPAALSVRAFDGEGDGLLSAALVDGEPALPPLALPPMHTLRGALSVHTSRSHDAEGSLDEVSRAARRARLDFVVLGDHPGAWADGEAAGPAWKQGVLVVGGLELVVSDVGRLLVTGLDTVPRRWDGDLPSLLAGLPDEGGFASVIHPRSPRARERWRAPDVGAVHAWEVMDVSEMARRRLADRWMPYHLGSLVGGLVTGRGHESLLRLDREGFGGWGLAAYDTLRASGPLTITGGLNHHPKSRLFGGPFPAYEPFFRAVVNHVLVPGEPSEDADRAWADVAAALRAGRSYVSMGDPDGARDFRFGAESSDGWIEMGGSGIWWPGTSLRVRMPQRTGRLLVRVVEGGREHAWLEASGGSSFLWAAPRPGIYRVEVYRAGRRIGPFRWNMRPWLLSNPVELTTSEALAR